MDFRVLKTTVDKDVKKMKKKLVELLSQIALFFIGLIDAEKRIRIKTIRLKNKIQSKHNSAMHTVISHHDAYAAPWESSTAVYTYDNKQYVVIVQQLPITESEEVEL